LLALNAAIEERADGGSRPRFAVVADEDQQVARRTLPQRHARTSPRSSTITGPKRTSVVVMERQKAPRRVEGGATLADKAGPPRFDALPTVGRQIGGTRSGNSLAQRKSARGHGRRLAHAMQIISTSRGRRSRPREDQWRTVQQLVKLSDQLNEALPVPRLSKQA